MTMQQLVLDMGLSPVPTLDNFIPGHNTGALEHLRHWSQHPLSSPLPTYLWGPGGSGKTHLLLAVREQLRGQGIPVGWIDCHVAAPPEFDDRWGAVIFDDCHLYTPVQQAMTFNWFINAQSPRRGPARWVLASADCPPADLALREDLRSRLAWGDVFQLQILGESDCRIALRRAADERGVALGDEVVDFMLKRFSRDLGSLMVLLETLDRYALRTQRAITIPLIKAMLESE